MIPITVCTETFVFSHYILRLLPKARDLKSQLCYEVNQVVQANESTTVFGSSLGLYPGSVGHGLPLIYGPVVKTEIGWLLLQVLCQH